MEEHLLKIQRDKSQISSKSPNARQLSENKKSFNFNKKASDHDLPDSQSRRSSLSRNRQTKTPQNNQHVDQSDGEDNKSTHSRLRLSKSKSCSQSSKRGNTHNQDQNNLSSTVHQDESNEEFCKQTKNEIQTQNIITLLSSTMTMNDSEDFSSVLQKQSLIEPDLGYQSKEQINNKILVTSFAFSM